MAIAEQSMNDSLSQDLQSYPVWPMECPVADSKDENMKDQITEFEQKVMTVDDAVQQYSLNFGKQQQTEEQFLGFNRKAFPWGNKAANATLEDGSPLSEADVKSAFEKDLKEEPIAKAEIVEKRRYRFQSTNTESREQDSDGEEVWICKNCSLPLGDIRYTEKEDDKCKANGLHGECMAQSMLRKCGSEDAKKISDDRKEKDERHEAYDIGWKVQHIPRNASTVGKLVDTSLAMKEVPQGMVCLVLDEETKAIRVASTLEPAAAVNLEYLSIALKVRRIEGHEPVFSLDPTNPGEKDAVHEKHKMQEKVFVPEWLAGTSVGEVLFQADYHLKELSMGEFDQPVVGMKSCFDLSEMEEAFGEWSAREWFLVRKAEMQISDNNALIPFVKMGVEAREQVVKGNSLLDKQVTRPDHPMVRYAEAFTKNFDLIAERKSVIFHLRELAKTSVIAKYLLDAQVPLEESWFQLAIDMEIPCSLEVPQLWNEKAHSKLSISDQCIESDKTNGKGSYTHAVYGGVNFGLDKFNLASSVAGARGAAAGLQASVTAGLPHQRLSLGPLARRGAMTTLPYLATSATAVKQPLGLSSLVRPGGAPAAGVQMVTPSVGKLGVATGLSGLMPSRAGIMPAASGLIPSRGVVPAAQQLAKVQGVFARGLPSAGAPASLTAYGRQFAPPGVSGVAAPRMPAFASPSASVSAVGMPRLAAGALTASLAAPRLAGMLAPPTMSLGAAQALGAGMPGAPQLQGVDLRLDNFDLSEAKRITLEANKGSWANDVRALDEAVAMGDAFWSGLDNSSKKVFQEDDYTLLSNVFNAALCDRRAEGDLFCPPDASHSYVTKLKELVKEEESVRQQRKAEFFSKSFVMGEPGTAFPHSWTSQLAASRATGTGRTIRNLDARSRGALVARPEYKGHAAELLESNLKTSAPVFDKSTEEGMRFRIYRMGSLEVRTTEELGSEEHVGAVFSVKATSTSGKAPSMKESISTDEQIVHATEFVERAFVAGAKASANRRYYLVLETKEGHMILTERLLDGTVTWEENPEELEDRNSLAKVTRASACQPGVVVQDLKTYQSTVAKGAAQSGVASPSVCKRFARSAYARAVGSEARRGFISNPWWMDVAKEKMEAAQEDKQTNFIALPNSMLKKA